VSGRIITMRLKTIGNVASLSYTVQHVMALLKTNVLVLINIPAMNKWTQMFLAIAKVMLGFIHQFVPVGLARSLKRKTIDDPDPPELLNLSLESVFSAPANDPTIVWRKEKGYRQNRACKFLANPLAPVLLIIWLCCAKPVMGLHFLFFARAKDHYLELPEEKRKKRAQFLFDLCNKEKSKAQQAYIQLESMINPEDDGYRKGWRLLFAYAGNEWGANVRQKC